MVNPAEISAKDLRLILDYVPSATILVDRRSMQIVSANQAFMLMSQFAYDEILRSSVDVFLKVVRIEGLPDGHVQSDELTRKDMQSLPVRSTIHYFGKKDQYLLVKVHAQKQENIDQITLFENVANEQARLINEIHKKDFVGVLRELALFTGEQINSDHSIIYLVDSHLNNIIRIPDNDDIFPAELPVIEMSRVKKIDHWEPGKRVLSEIHRVGRINRINSLYIIELVSNKRPYGLWVIAYRHIIENSSIVNHALLLSDWLVTILDIYHELEKVSRIEDEYAENLAKNQAILEIFRDGYVILDDNFRIVEFNKIFQDLVGYSPAELINGSMELIMSPKSAEKVKSTIDYPEDSDEIELFQIHDRKGNELIIHLNINSITDAQGKKTILLIRDITELIHNKNKLDQAAKKAALGEVVADFAHEVRNPINNLTTGLQVLGKILDPDPTHQDIINRMQEDCIRMNYLMESVLAFSRQSGESFNEVDLFEIINRLVFRLKNKYSEKGIDLIFRSDIAEDKAFVSGDQRALEQVLINLINNSYDTIYETGGAISVVLSHTKDHPKHYCMQIADTGSGIPQDIKKKIFEPFVSEKPGGTGLGLAIVQKIIQSHNGWIDLESFPGGTIFNIYLPIFIRGEEL